MVGLTELVAYTDELLDVTAFKDYAPNGLQIEGRSEVTKIVSGVTASLELVEAAIVHQADVLLVHHGYFWRGESLAITGMKQRRIKALLANDISLLGYHLPLDAHPSLGNNVELARLLGFKVQDCLGENKLLMCGELDSPTHIRGLIDRITTVLGRAPLHISGQADVIKKVAWCSGGAQDYFEQACVHGVDVFITGEASEQCTHIARELGVHFIAAGHHATERYGIQALAEHLSERFRLDHCYVEINNPI